MSIDTPADARRHRRELSQDIHKSVTIHTNHPRIRDVQDADCRTNRGPTHFTSKSSHLRNIRGDIGASATLPDIEGAWISDPSEQMTVRAVEATQFGPHAAIVPEVSGTAHIIGRNELYLDPEDPLGKGFNFR